MLAEIKIRLASRASEELFLGTVLDKSAGDIKRARELARYVISYMNPGDALFVPDETAEMESGVERASTTIPRLAPAPSDEGTDEPQPTGAPGPMDAARPGACLERGRRPAGASAHGRAHAARGGRAAARAVRRGQALLLDNEAEVHRLARALAEKGELEAEDVRRILNGKLPPRSPDALLLPPPVAAHGEPSPLPPPAAAPASPAEAPQLARPSGRLASRARTLTPTPAGEGAFILPLRTASPPLLAGPRPGRQGAFGSLREPGASPVP